MRRGLLALVAAGALQLTLASAASAITVNTTAMDTTVNGNCTLYEAVLAANTGANVDNCTGANVGSDTIGFSVTGPIVLNAGQMNVATGEPLIINGPAGSPGVTIEAGTASRIFNADATLELDQLALEGVTATSQDGGVVKGSGLVTLTDVTMDDNQLLSGGHGACVDAPTIDVADSTLYNNKANGFGGCLNGGTITVTNSSLFGNTSEDVGGAIHSSTLATVVDSFIGVANQGNTADGGGAIQVSGGNLVVQNSSFVANRATQVGVNGGAILWQSNGTATITDSTFGGDTLNKGNQGASGGAIWATAGTMNMTGSTFYSNSATHQFGGAGAIGFTNTGGGSITNSTFMQNMAPSGSASIDMSSSGSVTIRHGTFRFNGSPNFDVGKDSSGSMTLASSIIASPVNGGNACNTFVLDGGYNDIFPSSSAGACPTTGTNTTGDPALGNLQDNGGPTETMMLGSGSTALDAIPFAQCDVGDDQRGLDRPFPVSGACDIGAVEDDFRADGLIAEKGGPFVGNDLYNNDAQQTLSVKRKPGGAAKFTVQAQNDAPLSTDDLTATGAGGNKHFRVKYKDSGKVVTSQVTGGGYDLGAVDPGGAGSLTMSVKVMRDTRAGKHIDLPVTVASQILPERDDTVVATITSK